VSDAPPLAAALHHLANLAEIRGADAEAADLRRAADALDALGPARTTRLLDRLRRERDDGDADLGAAVRSHLRELALGGADEAILAARTSIPRLLRRLLELRAITSADGVILVQRSDILTLPDLTSTLDDGTLAQTVDAPLLAKLRRAAEALEFDVQPITLGRASDLFDLLLAGMAMECPAIEALTPSGDVRRVEPLVSSMVLVGQSPDPAAAVDSLCLLPLVDDVLHRSGRRAIVVVQQTEVDIRIAAPAEYGTVLFSTTGSRAHVAAMHTRRGQAQPFAREANVYEHAGLPFIPPELRQGTGEIEAAASGELPSGLVSSDDIRGDLHTHTNYSDGRDTIEVMVAECAALGYAYMAITDHSESAAALRTVTIDQLARQRDEIAAVRERYPGIVILHGIEVDILPDGRLDFPDSALEGLDIVLASLHDPARQDSQTLTRRCLNAIHHPLVTVITHPANRLVGRRPGYALDYDAVFAAAAETGTALEIDGAPSHLDLDGTQARAAVTAGVTVVIDSDCHRVQALERQMRLGIGTARRGWVERNHVLNARPLEAVRAFIAAKRARR
jgi:DNA polymerase (family 10)